MALEILRHGPVAILSIFLRLKGFFTYFPFLGVRSKNAFSVFVWCEKLHKYKCLVCFAEVRMPCVCGLVFFYEFR